MTLDDWLGIKNRLSYTAHHGFSIIHPYWKSIFSTAFKGFIDTPTLIRTDPGP